MRKQFTEFSLTEIRPLVEESQHAFLPSKNNPGQTTSDMLMFFTADPEFRIFGFEEKSEPLSYIVALSDRKRSASLAIGPMYVSEKHRGEGIGKEQLVQFLVYAKAKGCNTVFTKTWGNNMASRAVFEDAGFSVESIKARTRVDGDDTVNYLLHLTKEDKS